MNFKKISYTLLSTALLVNLASFSYAEPPNIGLLVNTAITYHDSGQYQHELEAVAKRAQTYITKRADENRTAPHPKKLALVLDIDETSLSNYDQMVLQRFGFSNKVAHELILSGKGKAIKPILELYQDALKKGIDVFFITGRHESDREATISNLKQQGYTTWKTLYLQPDDARNLSVVPYKSEKRAKITKDGYTIIASIGDQVSDLEGGYAENIFKLPNPYYYLP